jgi:DNA-binding CsgD family transcriptional regulator
VLNSVRLARVELDRADFMPPLLQPLMSALEHRRDPGATIVGIVRRLGFENVLYGASTSPKLDQESRSYVFTTLPRDWVTLYDQRAYIEIDPRLGRALDSALPLIWDYCSEYGQSAKVDEFLDASLERGVGSGVVVGLHGPRGVRVILALSNSNSRINAAQRQSIANKLGEIVLFAIYFHEIFMKAFIEQGVAPSSHGARLSARELECLSLAAHGQTTRDMSFKLGISERTIQFHFDSIRSKLGAANRQEAVAKAMSQGLIAR